MMIHLTSPKIRLQDVEYISGVSGGTYVATAFASHVVAAERPQGSARDPTV